jgi:ubiquinone/menaquinone biosynthesis C-methylase UbiE
VPETKNVCAGPLGAIYAYYIEREWLARLVGRVVWGIDVSSMYASMSVIGKQAAGATILDVPCGGGVAFRGLSEGQPVRYIAVDLDREMLDRARRRATARSLGQVETVQADMCSLPIPDASVDLCLCYSGLHMLADPEQAIGEILRCLKPDGELVGAMFLTEGSRRQRFLIKRARKRGEPWAYATSTDLHRWLLDAGIVDPVIEPEQGFVVFHGQKA